jgi:glucokinase
VGCLESLASMGAMVAAAGRADPSIVDEAALIAALRAGNESARQVVRRGGRMLGQAIAAVIGVLNVHDVLLIGPAIQLGPEWLAAVREQAIQSALPQLSRHTRIDLGEAREEDVLIGASALLMTQELGLSLVR